MQERAAEPGREPTSPHPSRGTDGCHLSSGKIIKFLHRFIFWHIPYSLPARGEPQVTFCSGFQSLPSLWHIWVPSQALFAVHTHQQWGKGSAGAARTAQLELCQGSVSNLKAGGMLLGLICHCCCSQGHPLPL